MVYFAVTGMESHTSDGHGAASIAGIAAAAANPVLGPGAGAACAVSLARTSSGSTRAARWT
ncbi:protein of unknown function [Stenotrophomonas maltophilia]|nr:protein of unknown function [Stenotrophomonas maltophilia]